MADEVKHTPGPWETFGARPVSVENGTVSIDHAATITHWPIKRVYRDEQGRRCTDHFAETYPCGRMAPEEVEANARLIVAAPDMLAALKLALARMEGGYMDKRGNYTANFHDDDIEPIRAAIAKAEPRP